MDRKYERNLALDGLDRPHQAAKRRRMIDVRRTVERKDSVVSTGHADFLQVRRGELPTAGDERIDHHVADEMNPLVRNALAPQVLAATRLADEQPLADRVGHNAVDLFGHRAVEASQARLDMGHRDAQLHARPARRRPWS